MSRLTRSLSAVGLVASCWLIAAPAGAVGAKGKRRPDSGTAYAAITHTVGNTQYAAGNVVDKVIGTGAVTFVLTIGTGSKPGTIGISGTVTVYAATGSLSGTDTADVVASANGLTFKNGTLKLTKGRGGQKGHSFIGTFTGTGKSATGPFTFHYKGTYR